MDRPLLCSGRCSGRSATGSWSGGSSAPAAAKAPARGTRSPTMMVRYAPAVDLSSWHIEGDGPVLGPGTGWDRGLVLTPSVVSDDGGYRMWYTGGASLFDFGSLAIGHARSTDGITWSKHPEPVLVGRDGEWDHDGVGMPVVLEHEGFVHMWYGGGGGNPDSWDIGYARSTDGITWERFREPAMRRGELGEWNADVLGPGTVMAGTDGFRMWFFAGTGSVAPGTAETRTGIGYATSSDGRRWTPHREPQLDGSPFRNSAPVLLVDEGGWDANYVITPNVVAHGGSYHLFYSGWTEGGPQAIGYATSQDGIHWARHPHPILTPPAWAFALISPSVIVEEDGARMWFQGWHGTSGVVGLATTSPSDRV